MNQQEETDKTPATVKSDSKRSYEEEKNGKRKSANDSVGLKKLKPPFKPLRRTSAAMMNCYVTLKSIRIMKKYKLSMQTMRSLIRS